jgi:hypothetical membrane protein
MYRFFEPRNLMVTTLRLGIAVPFLYIGIQLIAAPFYAGYDFMQMAASLLGSDRSSLPVVFNLGAIFTGFAAAVAAFGFLRVFPLAKSQPILAWLTAIAVFCVGLSSLWAGVFPMPDPRHAENPFAIGLFAMPFVTLATFWNQPQIRPYLIAAVVLFLGLIPIMSGIVPVDRQALEGVLQRLLALAAFSPIGLGAYQLFKLQQETDTH